MAGLIVRGTRSILCYTTGLNLRAVGKDAVRATGVLATSPRCFATQETDLSKAGKTVAAEKGEYGDFMRDINVHKNSDKDKVVLVKAGMYKSAAEVPDSVPISQIRKARDYMRVRMNIWMLGATLGGCIAMIFYGRKLKRDGHSLETMEDARRSKVQAK